MILIRQRQFGARHYQIQNQAFITELALAMMSKLNHELRAPQKLDENC
jgi:hypothetical protein